MLKSTKAKSFLSIITSSPSLIKHSKIKGNNFTFGTSGAGEDNNIYPLMCKDKHVQHIDKGVPSNIYYDCENKTWVRDKGENKEPHTFYTDYICGQDDVIADCFQSWGKCKFKEGSCKRDYETKSKEINGIKCRDDEKNDGDVTRCINYKQDPNKPETGAKCILIGDDDDEDEDDGW